MSQKIVVDDTIASAIKKQTTAQIVSSQETAAKFLEIASHTTKNTPTKTTISETMPTDKKESTPQDSSPEKENTSTNSGVSKKKKKNLTGSQKRRRRKEKMLQQQQAEISSNETKPKPASTTTPTTVVKEKVVASTPKSTSEKTVPQNNKTKKKENIDVSKKVTTPKIFVDFSSEPTDEMSNTKKDKTKKKEKKVKNTNKAKVAGQKVGAFFGGIVSFLFKFLDVIISIIESRILLGGILILFAIYLISTMF